jgi:hypothetical protein
MLRAPDGFPSGVFYFAIRVRDTANIRKGPYERLRESHARRSRITQVSDGQEKIAIRVEVNEDEKTAFILIPWERLAKLEGAEVLEWIARAARVRAEWEARGYRCN